MALPHISVSLLADIWIESFLVGGPIPWPPRLPDLYPPDFYLQVNLKSLVYSSPVNDVETLKSNYSRYSDNLQTCQELGTIFGWPWNVELRPASRQGVDIWNIYCKVMRGAECHRQTLKPREAFPDLWWYKWLCRVFFSNILYNSHSKRVA
jgi:hypothetical protein